MLFERIQESMLDLIDGFIKLLPGITFAILIILLTSYAANLSRRLIRKTSERLVKSPSLQLLAMQIARIGTWTVGLIIAATAVFPDLKLGDIVGLLGLGSVAIGFAFQDIFKNFLAGVLLLIEEPFSLGDQVIIETYEGTVQSIKIRSTQIKTYTGELVEIPNALVFTSPVRVMTYFQYRRTDLDIGVDYNTSLEVAKQLFLETIDHVNGVLKYPEPEVDAIGFGASSIDFKVRYWTKPERAEVRRIQSKVAIAIKIACDEAGITIPYPIRTVHFYDQEKFNESQR